MRARNPHPGRAVLRHPVASPHRRTVNTRSVFAGILCVSVLGFARPAAAVIAPAPTTAAPAATTALAIDETEDLIGRIRLLGDRVSVEVLARLAKIGTPAALAGFELALDGEALKSPVARARALRALGGFAKNKDLGGRVREMLALQAANARSSIEGLAALDTLASSGGIAREWLKRIVESAAPALVRVRALELHAQDFEAEDRDFYQELWETSNLVPATPPSDPRPADGAEATEAAAPVVGPPLRAFGSIAFEVLAKKLDEAELRAAMNHANARVRATAMLELGDRGDKTMSARARQLFLNASYAAHERAAGAFVYGTLAGWADVFSEIARGLDTRSPDGGRSLPDTRPGVDFSNALADLIAVRGAPNFVPAVADVLEGREFAVVRAFCARAIGKSTDKGAEKLLRELLEDEDLTVRVAALRTLALRGTDGARKLLDAARDKAPTDVERGILVELTTELFGGDPKWIAELESLAKGAPSTTKNAALTSLARIGGDFEALFAAALVAEAPWGTQDAALRALRDLRSREAIDALVAALERLDERVADEAMEMLRQMTGERFRGAEAWKRWWSDNAATFTPLTAQEYADLIANRELEADRAAGDSGRTLATFFGVELESERLAFVIDASGSMREPIGPRSGGGAPGTGGGSERRAPQGGTRMEVAKNELLHFLRQLPETALVNVVRFSDGADRWSDALKSVANEKSFASIRAYVERMAPEGGTNVHGALQLAFADPDVDTIMFLSDGTPSVGEVLDIRLIADHVRIWNANRGVRLHVISIGEDQPVLQALAEESGGSYVLIR